MSECVQWNCWPIGRHDWCDASFRKKETSEDERLTGKRSDDLIEAGGGDDIVDGRSWSETLTGGARADFFYFGPC